MRKRVGVRRERRFLASGEEVIYLYNRKTGERIYSEDGTPEFYREIKRQNKGENGRDFSLGDMFDLYMETAEYKGLRSSTQVQYEYTRRKLERFLKLPVSSMRRGHVLRIRALLSDTPGAANTVMGKLSTVMRYAMDIEVIDSNPCQMVRKLKVGKHEPWTEQEIATYLDGAKDYLRMPVILALYTCQRLGDLVSLPWSSYDGTVISLTQQKTGTPVFIPVHSALKAELDGMKRTSPQILTKLDGRPWTYNGLRATLSREFERLGMPHLRFHGLRKSGLIRLAEHGCTAPEIMSISGHQTIGEMQKYVEAAERKRMAEAAIRKTERGNVVRIDRREHG